MSVSLLTKRQAGDAFLKIFPAGGSQEFYAVAAASMTDTQTNTIIQKFIFAGTDNVGNVSACKFLWFYSSGVLGSGSFFIKSADLATTYFQADFTFTAGPDVNVILTANVVTALPAAETTLVFCYSTDAAFNHPNDKINGFLLKYN